MRDAVAKEAKTTPVEMTREALTHAQLARYARQVILPEVGIEGQQRLLRAKVLIVGASGLGSPAAIYLAAAGVGTIGIVDADAVELSNLHRQVVHDDAGVGKAKTTSARERLTAQNPDVHVMEHRLRLDSSNALEILSPYDVVVNGCDNFPTRYLVNDACVLLGKPLVDASILRFEGQATVFLPGKGCYRCLFPQPPPPGAVPSCAEAGIIGALAGHMGTLQAMETIKLILGVGDSLAGKMLLYDALTAEHRRLSWRRDPDCPVCGDRPTVTSLIDYQAFCGLPGERSGDSVERAGDREGADDNAPPGGVEVKERVDELVGPAQPVVAAKGWARRAGEVKEKLGSEDVQWIDVREPAEYRAFHIPGAVHIPLGELPRRMGEIDKAKEAIIVCFSGERSAAATLALRKHGYPAYNLSGGMVAWVNERLPITR